MHFACAGYVVYKFEFGLWSQFNSAGPNLNANSGRNEQSAAGINGSSSLSSRSVAYLMSLNQILQSGGPRNLDQMISEF